MARPIPLLLTLLLACLLGSAVALQVTPGSSCASICLDVGEKDVFDPAASSTNTSDIVCQDASFSLENKGKKFQSCLECLQKSKKVDDKDEESDLHWYIYNLRYTLTTCLFSVPRASPNDRVNSPCVLASSCGTLKGALTEDRLNPKNLATYGYCDVQGGLFSKPEGKLDACITCLQGTDDQAYLANFMIALKVGCQQQPNQGELLQLTGSPFTPDIIGATKQQDNVRSRPEGAGSTTLTTGAIVGIAIGAGLMLFGAITLFYIHWRRQRKIRKSEKTLYRSSQAGTPDPILPPGGTQMSSSLRTYSAQSNYGKGGAIVNSGEYYDKLEEEIRAGNLRYNHDPRTSTRPGPSGLPAPQPYIPRAPSNLHHETNPTGRRTLYNSTMARHVRSHTTGSVYQPSDFSTGASSIAVPQPTRGGGGGGAGGFVIPPPPPPLGGPPTRGHRGTPSLNLPIAPKLRLPRQYEPPTMAGQGESAQGNDDNMQIPASWTGEGGVIGLGLSQRPLQQGAQ